MAAGTPEAPEAEPPPERPAELRLARLHLRTGSYALARVELETAAGSGTLDADAMLDLAEIRWRTDDLTGAGEAAAAYLAAGRESLIALAIAAEATAALGRPAEAGRLARRAVEIAEVPLDTLFAGIRRSDVWPAEIAVTGPEIDASLILPVGASPMDASAMPVGQMDGAGGGPAAAGVPAAAAMTVERSVDRTELYVAEEVFLVGTGAQVSPVTRIDHRAVGEGVIGPVTGRIKDVYFDAVRGRLPAYASWLTPVY